VRDPDELTDLQVELVPQLSAQRMDHLKVNKGSSMEELGDQCKVVFAGFQLKSAVK
jgi:hypothetical protein